MRRTIYIISGQICSGKTTFSKKLQESTGALRFTPDEIMQKIYPFKIKKEEFDSYFYKCCDVSMVGAIESFKRGFDVILDFGFWKKEDRNTYKNIAKEVGAESKLFFVKCAIETIKNRLYLRNKNISDGSFHISEEEFDFYSPGFEEPSNDELFEIYNNN